jgi:hypothetical protein
VGVDDSRLDVRTVVLALLCLAALSFAAATLNSTTSSDTGLGTFGQGDQRGGQQTPVEEPTGDGRGDRWALIDLGPGGEPIALCTPWLSTPLAHAAILFGLLGVFLVGRWYDDAAMGLALTTLVGYPGFFVYLLLTGCRTSESGELLDITSTGNPAQEGGGLLGGQGSAAAPSLLSQVLLVGVVGLLAVVAVLVLTGDHDQRAVEETGDGGEAVDDEAVDVAAVGAAAGRAADRIEESDDDEFANEVYRAWADMTDSLTVDHPESSTPGEFAAAAVDAGMDRTDVERLTRLFSDVRYGGEEPTPEHETAAVETLRRIETAYAEGES